ncbi:sensor domain-containing diguanylate cyclase [Roseospira goensis]|uniref:diguanylate cyclase n=1 Tax=Roseospira goensis TaxID=391922 RepID=A0A7W6RZG1_9PROT|nr:sensor domain-containing diguanylate cyclase [Roseospira goensis]MBB4285982.1 diguanylate cyclase (GGDEF)-like protein/PAS domain S-box-containing protein [Roseospira goensis]
MDRMIADEASAGGADGTLAAVFRQSRWPVAEVDDRLVLRRANSAFAALAAGTPPRVAGCRLSDLALPEAVVTMARDVVRTGLSGEVVTGRGDVAGTDGGSGGETFLLEPIVGTDGTTSGVLLLGDGAPQHGRSASPRRPGETDYRLIAENQAALIVKVDAENRFLYVNPAYCALFGRSAGELTGETFMPLVHEADRAATAAAMDRLREPPHTAYLEQRALTVRGWRWLAWQDTAVLDDQGRITAIIGVGHDITERRTAQMRQRRTLENLKAFFELSQDLLLVLDERGRIREINAAVTGRLGWTRPQLIGRSVIRLLSRHHRYQQRHRIRAILDGRSQSEPFTLGDRAGRPVPVETRVVRGTWDDAPALFTSSRDLSELSLLREKFERVFLDNATLMAITEPETGRFIDVNMAFLRALGLERAQVIGRNTVDLGFFQTQEARRQVLADVEARSPGEPTEMGFRLTDGRTLVCQWTSTRFTSGGAEYMLTMLTDITRQHELMAELERKANHDALTGALSRQKGAEELEREILRCRRHTGPLSLILADVDDFKRVNDRHGHIAGDRVLQALATRLRDRIRQTDRLVRWGGEEFLVILPSTDLDGALRLAEALRGTVGDALFDGVGRVTMSMGVARWRVGDSLETWINRADEALYRAKRTGRNRVIPD